MWVMTRFGFYSVVLAEVDPAQSLQGNDPNRVMVRARLRRHLEALAEVNPVMCDYPISETSHTDYRFRILCPKSVWAKTHASLLDDLDYPNFKSACEVQYGWDDPYCGALHDVWGVMYRLQKEEV